MTEDHPMEVQAYLVDEAGVRLTEEQHVVLVPGEGERAGQVSAQIERVFETLPGMEDRQPAAIAFRFVDGHVATGEVPEGAWERVAWEEEEDDG